MGAMMRSGFRGFAMFNAAMVAMAAAAISPNSKNAVFASRPEYTPRARKSYDELPTSRYYPHQGRRECARRLRQQAKIAARKEAAVGTTQTRD